MKQAACFLLGLPVDLEDGDSPSEASVNFTGLYCITCCDNLSLFVALHKLGFVMD
jgi:hypothetical protein